MFHVDKNEPVASDVCVNPLESPDTKLALDTLLQLLQSCTGPEAKIHMVQNSLGGHVTITSDSQRLLSSMSFSRQLLKVIVSCVQGQLKEFGDGGKYLSVSCLMLIKKTLQAANDSASRDVFCVLYEYFIKIVSDYIKSDECVVCKNVDLTDIQVVLAYIRSILASRPLLNLSEDCCNSLSKLVLKCFVESIPEQHQQNEYKFQRYSDGFCILGSYCDHPRESRLISGLLLECPQLPIIRQEIDLDITTYNHANINSDLDRQSSENVGECIRVVLITCSMSGDLEEIVSATYELTEEQSALFDKEVLDKWRKFCEKLANSSVGILLCQRVIHPKLKILLKSLGVLAIERLGSAVIPLVQDLTGAKPISSVSVSDPEEFLGTVTCAKHVIENDKSYLHLQQPASSLVTLVLCSKTEEALEELKSCVRSALRGLYSLPNEGKFLFGGGCWQMHCSYVLSEEVKKQLPSLASSNGCTQSQVWTALSVFCSSVFHSWARLLLKGRDNGEKMLMVDPLVQHCWSLPAGYSTNRKKNTVCGCGLKQCNTDTSSFQYVDDRCQPLWTNPTTHIQEDCMNDYKSDSSKPLALVNNCHTNNSLINEKNESDITSGESADKINVDGLEDCDISKKTVLDRFSSSTQALYKAVFTAKLVLSLAHVLCEGNTAI